eukprot:scaffold38245_cov33-Tisochrysis_lutea.AAC.2
MRENADARSSGDYSDRSTSTDHPKIFMRAQYLCGARLACQLHFGHLSPQRHARKIGGRTVPQRNRVRNKRLGKR